MRDFTITVKVSERPEGSLKTYILFSGEEVDYMPDPLLNTISTTIHARIIPLLEEYYSSQDDIPPTAA